MAFSPLTKRENWNWHNIIATCERVNNWKRNRLFKETFFAAILDSPAPKGYEQFKQPIRDIVIKYRPDPKQWWYPEIVEYFYPDYLQSKAGAYFTPKPYCELLAQIAQKYIKSEWREEGLTAYDPACGVGALLITFKQYEPQATIYGQELDHESVLIAQELLTNKKGGDFNQTEYKRQYTRPNFNGEGDKWIKGGAGEKTGIIRSGDTLKHDKFKRKFHIVLANPPFNQELKDKEIISKYGTNKGNIAWVKQVLARMKADGIGLIILPGGILATDNFKEGRKFLIKYNWLDAIFYNFRKETGKKTTEGAHRFSNAETDTCFLVLRKRRRTEQFISFIDCENKELNEIITLWQQRERERESRNWPNGNKKEWL